MSELKIEYWSIDRLQPYENNFRTMWLTPRPVTAWYFDAFLLGQASSFQLA